MLQIKCHSELCDTTLTAEQINNHRFFCSKECESIYKGEQIIKCYNDTCPNTIDLATKGTFCCDECKAKYWGISVERLHEPIAKSKKKTLAEWQEEFKKRGNGALQKKIDAEQAILKDPTIIFNGSLL